MRSPVFTVAPLALCLLAACAPQAEPEPSFAPTANKAPPSAASINWDTRAAEALARSGRPGAIVVLEASSGAVLASVERIGGSVHPATEPRAPGSTVKPVLALAALHEQLIEPDEAIPCEGARKLDGQRVTCFADHGPLDLAGGLRTSCNHYAYELANRLGRDRIEPHFMRFGIQTGGGRAQPAEIGTGHGGVTLSPLGLARAYAALATAGTTGARGDWPYSADALAQVRAALRGAVEHEQGTGRAAGVAGLAVAGKTGTADTETEEGPVRLSWFAGWAPAEDPQVIIVVQLEGEGTGPELAAPVAGELFADLAPVPGAS